MDGALLDLVNSADEQQLSIALTADMASKILSARGNGFTSLSDFAVIPGLGAKKIDALRNYFTGTSSTQVFLRLVSH